MHFDSALIKVVPDIEIMDKALREYVYHSRIICSTAADGFFSLLDTGAYSDLTIRCGGYERKVHRAIICTRSDVFAAACKPNAFKVRYACHYLVSDD